jgi:hypothetical protein
MLNMKIAFIANDGKIFYNERDCRDWEKRSQLDNANKVLKDHVTLFGYDRYKGFVEMPYEQCNRAAYAYVKQLSDDNRVHQLYSLFIPWGLGDAINQHDVTGWYVLDSEIDKWVPWDEMKKEMEYLQQVEKDIAALTSKMSEN